jgi:hypothetical protein
MSKRRKYKPIRDRVWNRKQKAERESAGYAKALNLTHGRANQTGFKPAKSKYLSAEDRAKMLDRMMGN